MHSFLYVFLYATFTESQLMRLLRTLPSLVLLVALTQTTGCAVLTVADAVVTTAATAVKVTAKTVGAVAGAVIPDSSKKEEKSQSEREKK